MIFRIR